MTRTMTLVLALLSLTVGSTLAYAAKPGDKPKPSPEKRFSRMDKNSDEKLSLDEFVGKKQDEMKEKATKRFSKLDKDKDEFLSLDEFKAGMKPKK